MRTISIKYRTQVKKVQHNAQQSATVVPNGQRGFVDLVIYLLLPHRVVNVVLTCDGAEEIGRELLAVAEERGQLLREAAN